MNSISKNILFKFTALLLLIAVLAPISVKMAHVFSKHEHVVCTNDFDSHLHQIDLDCEFYKFNLNQTAAFFAIAYDLEILQNTLVETDASYDYLSDYQRLHFSLRAPPSL